MAAAQDHPDEWMTISEAVRALSISRNTVGRMIAAGKLRTRQDAIDTRLKLIRRADVEKLAQHSIRPGRPRKQVQPQPETEQEEDKS